MYTALLGGTLGKHCKLIQSKVFTGTSLVVQWLRLHTSNAGGVGLILAQTVKNGLQYRRHRFNLWVGKIPWRREWQPTPVFLPGKFHGQRSLAGYSPWCCKESDMTEQLTHTY